MLILMMKILRMTAGTAEFGGRRKTAAWLLRQTHDISVQFDSSNVTASLFSNGVGCMIDSPKHRESLRNQTCSHGEGWPQCLIAHTAWLCTRCHGQTDNKLNVQQSNQMYGATNSFDHSIRAKCPRVFLLIRPPLHRPRSTRTQLTDTKLCESQQSASERCTSGERRTWLLSWQQTGDASQVAPLPTPTADRGEQPVPMSAFTSWMGMPMLLSRAVPAAEPSW